MKIFKASIFKEGKSGVLVVVTSIASADFILLRTTLDSNPKVHGKPVDLYDLFQNIQRKGGYDKVSAEKLLWRKVAGEFDLNQHHAAASAFGVKTVYYKNLA